MSLRRALPTLLLAAVAWRCLPAPLDLTGKQCSVDRGCGPGYYCLQSTCQLGDEPPLANLLANPQLVPTDAGVITHWRATGQARLVVETSLVFDGGTAARLNSVYDGGAVPRLSADAVLDAGQYMFCGTIWVFAVGATGSTRVVLTLSARYADGGFTQTGVENIVQPTNQWTQLTANIDATQEQLDPDSLSFTVSTGGGFAAGQSLIFDDPWLWRPFAKQCP